MTLTFIETSGFRRHVSLYFQSDAVYGGFQEALLAAPDQGEVIQGCSGLRKMRWRDARRGKGTRGGLRIIYLHVPEAECILLLDMYGKDEADDLTAEERKTLAALAQTFRQEVLRSRQKGKPHGSQPL